MIQTSAQVGKILDSHGDKYEDDCHLGFCAV